MSDVLRVDFLQQEYPGKSIAEIARILAGENNYIAVIQFEGMGTQLAGCRTGEELGEVLTSPYCKEIEVIYHVASLKGTLMSLQAQGVLKYSVPQSAPVESQKFPTSPLIQHTVPAQSFVQSPPSAAASPALDAAIQKYMSREYTPISRTNTSATLKRQAPVNWPIFMKSSGWKPRRLRRGGKPVRRRRGQRPIGASSDVRPAKWDAQSGL